MKPDVIVSWPRHADYPLWRQFIRENRQRFAKVIVAFTDHDGHDYSQFVVDAMCQDDITAISTFPPPRIQGAMVSCHSGRNRATVSFRHSVSGNSSRLRPR